MTPTQHLASIIAAGQIAYEESLPACVRRDVDGGHLPIGLFEANLRLDLRFGCFGPFFGHRIEFPLRIETFDEGRDALISEISRKGSVSRSLTGDHQSKPREHMPIVQIVADLIDAGARPLKLR